MGKLWPGTLVVPGRSVFRNGGVDRSDADDFAVRLVEGDTETALVEEGPDRGIDAIVLRGRNRPSTRRAFRL